MVVLESVLVVMENPICFKVFHNIGDKICSKFWIYSTS